MFRLSRIQLVALILLFFIESNAQRPSIAVKSFDYIWQRNGNNGYVYLFGYYNGATIVLPQDDSIKNAIADRFIKAIENRWGADIDETSMRVKTISPFASPNSSPKFNTKLRDREPGKWYLFLQIYEKPDLCLNPNNEQELFTKLQLKCRLVDGSRDSVILDRTLNVVLFKDPVPPDENGLVRLPAYPASFVNSFDSITKWLFQPDTVNLKYLFVKPACLYEEIPSGTVPVARLDFNHDSSDICLLTEPGFSFFTPAPAITTINVNNNEAANILKGGLTFFAGIPTAQEKLTYYKADFVFDQGGGYSPFHCNVFFGERETKDIYINPDNSVNFDNSPHLTRFIDPDFGHVITWQRDTLVQFRIKYVNDSVSANANRIWDGSDSSTIRALPGGWKNKRQGVDVIVAGTLDGEPFIMKSYGGARIKEFFLHDKPVALFFGRNEPAKAWLYQPLPQLTVQLFTILCSMPQLIY
jgi:hypothetical protein